jgi:hypothetical protein
MSTDAAIRISRACSICRPGVSISVTVTDAPGLEDIVYHGTDGVALQIDQVKNPITQPELDAALAQVDSQIDKPRLTDGQLAQVLVDKGVLTTAEVDAAVNAIDITALPK